VLNLPISYLFVPGDRPERIPKARASGADAVIADLEDAVAPGAKVTARNALAASLSAAQLLIVRVNGVGTEWFDLDAELCRQPGVAAVALPKAESGDDIRLLAARIGSGIPILPIIESAKGLWNLLDIAQATGVQRLLFGPIDFQLDLGMQGGAEELMAFRTQIVLASRVAGIAAPVDGPTVAIDDAAQLRDDTLRAKRLGFGGKLCIHPKQVAIVQEHFSPSAEEIAWAQRVVSAASAAQGAAIAVDGKMIDRPVLVQAEMILERCRRVAQR
jgi:citrate lyase subunit beta/citryl-CoA lyase